MAKKKKMRGRPKGPTTKISIPFALRITNEDTYNNIKERVDTDGDSMNKVINKILTESFD